MRTISSPEFDLLDTVKFTPRYITSLSKMVDQIGTVQSIHFLTTRYAYRIKWKYFPTSVVVNECNLTLCNDPYPKINLKY